MTRQAGGSLVIHVLRWLAASVSIATTFAAGAADPRSVVAERVTKLTRDSSWTRVAAVPISFRTYHPQGLVKIGDGFIVSSVEVRVPTKRLSAPVDGHDRDAGDGIGHLFKIDAKGNLVTDLRLGEGTIYHPGGIDYDGTNVWVPVAEYRPNSRSIVYTVDPKTYQVTERFRVKDHIGGVVRDRITGKVHGVSWGSRTLYEWTTTGQQLNVAPNESHLLDHQD